MGTCVICGTDVDGHICRSHEQDVCFEFTGSRPGQLTKERFYRGSVDGIADFGVFIDIGDHVTGLLHESELDRRLESITWQPGDTVYVQVKNVRDNGNVDLGWSIRQAESEFRGSLVDTGSTEEPKSDSTSGSDASNGDGNETEEQEAQPEVKTRTATVTESEREERAKEAEESRKYEEADVADLEEWVDSQVRIEGEVVDVRQTSGPTIFEIRDETGAVECAAFESAGVRAYPEVETGDVVRLDGLVERRRGELQVETDELTALEGQERETIARQLETAVEERAEPADYEPLADDESIAATRESIVGAATTIRRAIFEGRPVVIRHDGSVDGFAGAAGIERAVLARVRDEHDEADAVYHYVDRRPLDGPVYDMEDAMRDVTSMLDAKERHGEKVPLFVFVDAAGTEESGDGLDLLSVYDARSVVIDGGRVDEAIAEAADAHVDSDDPATISGAALATEVAVAVDADMADDLRHLPALSYWRSVPDVYADLAAEAGYDGEEVDTLREAIALEAFYQAHGDKRELISDLLFGDAELAERASQQFRERVEQEVRTAESHLERRGTNGTAVGVLDTDAFTHRFDFPPARVLLAALAENGDGDAEGSLDSIVGVGKDSLLVWSERPVDVRDVATRVREAVPEAGVEARGGHDGEVVFLSGERDAVVDAAIEALSGQA